MLGLASASPTAQMSVSVKVAVWGCTVAKACAAEPARVLYWWQAPGAKTCAWEARWAVWWASVLRPSRPRWASSRRAAGWSVGVAAAVLRRAGRGRGPAHTARAAGMPACPGRGPHRRELRRGQRRERATTRPGECLESYASGKASAARACPLPDPPLRLTHARPRRPPRSGEYSPRHPSPGRRSPPYLPLRQTAPPRRQGSGHSR